jgi:hypothetical protein
MAYHIRFSDYPGTDTGPPDPERWIGPPGPPGPMGPPGDPGMGGTLTGPLILTTNTRIGLDTAAFGGVPNMFMRSDGGAAIFHADGWNDYTPTTSEGVNFKVFGNGGATEYWGVTGGPEGNGATLKVYSVSADWPTIGNILASNEGQLMLGNDTGTILNLQGPSGFLARNSIRLTAGGNGSPAVFRLIGESPGHMQLTANTTGYVYIGNTSFTGAEKGSLQVGGTVAATVNGFRIFGAPTGFNPIFSSVGDDTDIGITVAPKGSGNFKASNDALARGAWSTDMQRLRSNNTQLASGVESVLSGGGSNTAAGQYSVIGGGLQSNADGAYSTVPGGQRAWARGQYGWLGWASGVMQGIEEGDAQGSWRLLRGVTTASAAVRLTADGAAINSTAPNINSVVLGNDRATAMTVMLVGMDNTATTTRINAYFNEVLVGKDAVGAMVIAPGTARTLGSDIPTVAITVGAEGLLSIVVTPATANTWHFLAKLSCVEIM